MKEKKLYKSIITILLGLIIALATAICLMPKDTTKAHAEETAEPVLVETFVPTDKNVYGEYFKVLCEDYEEARKHPSYGDLPSYWRFGSGFPLIIMKSANLKIAKVVLTQVPVFAKGADAFIDRDNPNASFTRDGNNIIITGLFADRVWIRDPQGKTNFGYISKVEVYCIPHEHDLSYSLKDNAIVATCANTDGQCDLKDQCISLTLEESASTVSGIDYNNAEAWKKAVGADKLPKIMYATKGSSDYSENFTPTVGNKYVAKIELNGYVVTREFGIETHDVTVYLGTANATKNVLPGTTVTLTANTYEGKVFETWLSDSAIPANKNGSTTTFVMPNADVTIEGKFLNCYPLIVKAGDVHVDSPEAETTNVEITLPTTPEGQRFVGWTAEGVTLTAEQQKSPTFTLTMPSNKVVLTANFVDIYAVTVENGTATQNAIDGYIDGYAGVDSIVEITADNKENFRFDHWSGQGITFTNPNDATTTFTMPTKDVTVTANYVRQVAIPTKSTSRYVYNGKEQTYTLGNTTDSTYYTVSGTKQTNEGSYTVTVTLNDTTETEWTDGTTEAKTFTFTIYSMSVAKPVADTRTFVENGKEQVYCPVTKVNGKNYDFDGMFYNVKGNRQTKAGKYTVTVTLAKNYVWEDGTDKPLTFNFEIKPKAQMNARIYYILDIKEDELVDTIPVSYYLFNEDAPVQKKKISQIYTPYIYNVPAGAKVTFYLSETKDKKNPVKWDDVTMEYLGARGSRIWYIYADVTCNGYANYTTPITEYSCVYVMCPKASTYSFTKRQYTKVGVNIHITDSYYPIPLPYPESVTEYSARKGIAFSSMTDIIEQIIDDLSHGFYNVQMTDWVTTKSYDYRVEHLRKLRQLLNSSKSVKSVKSARAVFSRMALLSDEPQSPEFDLEFIESLYPGATMERYLVGESFDPELTPKINDSNVDMDFELELYSALLEIGEEGSIEREVTFEYMYVKSPEDNKSYQVVKKYNIGDMLSAEDIPTKEGYIFLGWYSIKPDEIVEIKPGEEAPKEDFVGEVGEPMDGFDYVNGMIRFNPETDVITENITLYARWMSIEDFNKVKADAIAALDALNNTDPLLDETVLTNAKTAINAAQTIEEIEETLIAIAEQQATELTNAKEEAIAALNAENDKAPINKAEILDAEVEKINACATKAEVASAKEAAIATIQARQQSEHTTMVVIIVVVVVVVLGAAAACFVLYKKGILFGKKKGEVEVKEVTENAETTAETTETAENVVVEAAETVAVEEVAPVAEEAMTDEEEINEMPVMEENEHVVVEAEEEIAPETKREAEWIEEDREYLAHHDLGIEDEGDGDYVIGVFFHHRKHKIYWFKYEGIDYALGEVACYKAIEGDMRDVVVAVPKIRKDMSGHEHELKSLYKKN